MGIKEFQLFWVRHNINIIASVLLVFAAVFYTGAEQFRRRANVDNPHLFTDGEIVDILDVVDGDEVVIGREGGGRTTLRILGIQSFNATVSDPLISEYGKICFDYIKSSAQGRKAKLAVATKRIDDEGRLLGSLFLCDENGQYAIGLAEDLLRKGYTLVYTRYDFPYMDAYLTVQDQAKASGAGLWSSERIAARASSLLLQWEQGKARD